MNTIKYYEDQFTSKINKSSSTNFYSWIGLKYFLYDYEYEKSVINKLEKVSWKIFSKLEHDEISKDKRLDIYKSYR